MEIEKKNEPLTIHLFELSMQKSRAKRDFSWNRLYRGTRFSKTQTDISYTFAWQEKKNEQNPTRSTWSQSIKQNEQKRVSKDFGSIEKMISQPDTQKEVIKRNA